MSKLKMKNRNGIYAKNNVLENPTLNHNLPIRFLNNIGKFADKMGLSIANRSAKSLMAAACRKTGLSDWGDDNFLEPLHILLESCRKEANLSSLGWMVFHEQITNHLSNRLLIQNELKRNPEIYNEPIEKPLFIVSLPRTGTTLLQKLLFQDTTYRSLLCWESRTPIPPPGPNTCGDNIRITKVEKELKRLYKIAPKLALIHHMKANEPEECNSLLANSLTFYTFHIFLNLPTYSQWLKTCDMVPVYQYYKLQLQMLQSRLPRKPWILKSPFHTLSLDALLTVFPDACILQTHRDPSKVLSSSCSLTHTVRSIVSDTVTPADIGKECFSFLERMLKGCIDARTPSNASNFYDIQFEKLVSNPVDTIKNIYSYFDLTFTAKLEKRILEWLSANKKDKYGIHKHSLEKFALDPVVVKNRFNGYRKRFQIPYED